MEPEKIRDGQVSLSSPNDEEIAWFDGTEQKASGFGRTSRHDFRLWAENVMVFTGTRGENLFRSTFW